MWLEILSRPQIALWPTFLHRVQAEVKIAGFQSLNFRSLVLSVNSYDTYILRDHPQIRYTAIESIARLLHDQIDGQEGLLSLNQSLNVFYLRGNGTRDFTIQIERFFDEYRKVNRWRVLGWHMPVLGVWPDWGTFRPHRSHILWEH